MQVIGVLTRVRPHVSIFESDGVAGLERHTIDGRNRLPGTILAIVEIVEAIARVVAVVCIYIINIAGGVGWSCGEMDGQWQGECQQQTEHDGTCEARFPHERYSPLMANMRTFTVSSSTSIRSFPAKIKEKRQYLCSGLRTELS